MNKPVPWLLLAVLLSACVDDKSQPARDPQSAHDDEALRHSGRKQ